MIDNNILNVIQLETYHAVICTFSNGDISASYYISAPFVAVSPRGSYTIDNDGLVLYLEKPQGKIQTKVGSLQ